MPSNVTLNDNTTEGAGLYTKQVSHDGDTVQLQGVSLVTVTGTEDSYTPVDVNAANPLPVDATGAGDVPVTLDGEAVVLGAGSASIGKLGANSGVDIGDVDVTSHPADTFVAEGGALGKGVLLQGDDGTDRKNINVDATTGDVQVDVTNTVTVDATSSGDVPITLDGETVTVDLGTNNDVVQPTHDNFNCNANVQQGNSDVGSGNPLQVTLANGSVPSHAVTNAGTFAVQADSVIPGTGSTNLGKAEDAAHVSGHVGVMGLAVRTDAPANRSGTDGDYEPLQVSAGRLWASATVTNTVDVRSNSANIATESTVNSIKTAVEIVDDWDESDRCKVNPIAGQAGVAGGSGTVGATTQRVVLATDVALPTGDNNIGNMDVASIAAGSNLVGDVGISGARTSGGTTPYKNLDVDESEDEVKGTAGQVYWIHAMNLAATKRYLKFYNATAATVEVGTTTPVLTFPIPTQGDTNGAGFNLAIPNGIAFSTAITIAATTGVADNDTGAPGANEVIVNLGYA